MQAPKNHGLLSMESFDLQIDAPSTYRSYRNGSPRNPEQSDLDLDGRRSLISDRPGLVTSWCW